MSVSRKGLCTVYGSIGVLAFLGTWGNVFHIVRESGFWAGTVRFWQDTLVNESSRFITVDVLFLGLAVTVWMVLEARRLEIPGVWLYVVFGLLVAISLTVPLFMLHREWKLAAVDPDSIGGTLRLSDVAGMVVLGLVVTAYAVVTLLQ